MKLIKPSVEILTQSSGLQGIYDMIELCGKTSYKSPIRGGEEAKKFVEARINEGHYAVLEFGTVYMCVPIEDWQEDAHEWEYIFPDSLPWVSINCDGRFFLITTNFRHIIERVGLETMKKYFCDYPVNGHTKRYCARFITDRGVSHELVRHRTMSFCQESTRYCNYSKDKFGNEVTFIIPSWMSDAVEEASYHTMIEDYKFLETIKDDALRIKASWFTSAMINTELCYLKQLEAGCTPQEARQILPNALKTEICMCGFEDAWEHFFDLRYRGTTGKPHPDMLNVATMLHNEFEKKGIAL